MTMILIDMLQDSVRDLDRISQQIDYVARTGEAHQAIPQLAPIDLAMAILKRRRRRDEVFGQYALFADPSWDILLDLMVSEHFDQKVSVGSACIAACVPATTGLRHLAVMQEKGLVTKHHDLDDGRRIIVSLTDTARKGMADALA